MKPADLPSGFGLVPDPGARRTDRDRVLIGGAPLRILRLTPAGARQVDAWWQGEPVGPGAGTQRLARRLLGAGLAHPRPGSPELGAADVTLVIPAHGMADGVEGLLTGAATAGLGALVVVDDGSPPADGAGLARAAERHGARLERNATAEGPAAARNRGWRLATTPAVAFIDADCEWPAGSGWIEGLLAHLNDPEVGLAAPRVVATPGRAPAWLAAYESARSPLDLGGAPAPVGPGRRVTYVPAAALMARRGALEEVGGFSEDLRVGEDVDLVWRLGEAGWTVRYAPEWTVGHRCRPDLPSWARQRFAYGTSAAALEGRHPGTVTPLAVSGWTALAWGAVGAGRPAVGAGVALATTAALAPKLSGLEHRWTEAGRLAGLGHLAAGRSVAEAMRRAWWPALAGAALVSRRARRLLLAVSVVPPLLEERPDSVGLLPWIALRLADDLSYDAGVWTGAVKARRLGALLPRLRSWPGRRPAVEDSAVEHPGAHPEEAAQELE